MKSFLGNFYRHLAIFFGHTVADIPRLSVIIKIRRLHPFSRISDRWQGIIFRRGWTNIRSRNWRSVRSYDRIPSRNFWGLWTFGFATRGGRPEWPDWATLNSFWLIEVAQIFDHLFWKTLLWSRDWSSNFWYKIKTALVTFGQLLQIWQLLILGKNCSSYFLGTFAKYGQLLITLTSGHTEISAYQIRRN